MYLAKQMEDFTRKIEFIKKIKLKLQNKDIILKLKYKYIKCFITSEEKLLIIIY